MVPKIRRFQAFLELCNFIYIKQQTWFPISTKQTVHFQYFKEVPKCNSNVFSQWEDLKMNFTCQSVMNRHTRIYKNIILHPAVLAFLLNFSLFALTFSHLLLMKRLVWFHIPDHILSHSRNNLHWKWLWLFFFCLKTYETMMTYEMAYVLSPFKGSV